MRASAKVHKASKESRKAGKWIKNPAFLLSLEITYV